MLVPEALRPLDRYISAKTFIRRERSLGGTGHVLVLPGTHVEPGDIVAEVQESGPIRVIDAARILGVAANKVEELLQVAVGDEVEEGQLLAQRGRFLKRSLVSPLSGVIFYLDARGRLLVRSNPIRQQIRAILRGTVVSVAVGQGIVIEAHGALVQGMWGNGKEDFGLLRMLVNEPNEILFASAITAAMKNTILVAGPTVDAAVLEKASTVQIKGLIVGSLELELIPLARQMPYPIMLTEGFGYLPINMPAFNVLGELDGRDAALSALYQPREGKRRPELFVPLSGSTEAVPAGPLALGDRVRLLSQPYLGRVGTIEESAGIRYTLANELHVVACKVMLDEGKEVIVPYSNIERLLP
ncbi:MAG: hypothetical protein H0T73_01350 [Ardenticatenales bacterium]|nr:hypothetical protein [Ardenticatenales bacterium]